MICVVIDRITKCLIEVATGKSIQTYVCPIKNEQYLRGLTKAKGWFADWQELYKAGCEIYALYAEGQKDIQGLCALQNDPEAHAVWASWICANPRNFATKENPTKQFEGVGGQLLAIAANKSVELGYHGAFHGSALNNNVAEHYVNEFGAI